MEISTLFQATTEGGGDDQDQEDYARSFALNDPDILKVLFSYLDTPSVKVARLLCKAWEDEASSILGKRWVLPLYHIFNTNTYEPKPVTLNLLQRIRIPPSSRSNIDAILVPPRVRSLCFMSFASKWDSLVREIDLRMEEDIDVTLPVTLKAFEFTNLRKIVIYKPGGVDMNFSLSVRCINSLKELKIAGINFVKSCSYPLLQSLINAAPNLESLNIDGNFYPNLAACAKLRSLKWSGHGLPTRSLKWSGHVLPTRSIKWSGHVLPTSNELRGIEMDDLFRMINEGGNHLEHLSLQFRKWVEFNKSFPTLPNLKSLTLDSNDVNKLLEWICPKLLPKLEMVSLNNHYYDAWKLTHKGVTSLKLLNVDKLEEIRMASKKFPNVKRLVIDIVGLEEKGQTQAEFVGSFLQACSNWKLLYFEVEMWTEFQLSQFLRGLRSLSLLEGIKEVKIVSYWKFSTDGVDDDLQEFQEVFQLSAKMSKMSFQGIKLQPTLKEKVLKFLSERKDLPVVYMD